MSPNEIAELAGISDSKNIGKWMQDKEKGGARPNYNALAKLLGKGATVETLFGVEYAKMHFAKSSFPSEFLEGLDGANDPESALNALVERKILEMKANGKI